MITALTSIYLRRANLVAAAEETLFIMALIADLFGAIGLMIWLAA
jgi:hypothetical protein